MELGLPEDGSSDFDGYDDPYAIEEEEATQLAPPVLGDPVIYTYDGVPILFPRTAYPSQQILMQKIVHGLRNGENCLLESPTGTGKTLALLCPVVAWVQKCKEEGRSYWSIPDVEDGDCECGFDVYEDCRIIQDAETKRTWARPYPNLVRIRHQAPEPMDVYSSGSGSEEDSQMSTRSPQQQEWPQAEPQKLESRYVDEICARCRLKYYKKNTPPKIYYTTRTVSQSKGNVRQFLATHYRDEMLMTILASRDKTCVEERVLAMKTNQETQASTSMQSRQVSVDEECAARRKNYYFNRKRGQKPALLRAPVCKYFHALLDVRTDWRNWQREHHVFDIEDLRRDGKKMGKCPYYGATLMHDSAEIVFCTYNYLIYKHIRQSSKADLLNSIVIFDEAHNIESTCTAASSKTFSYGKLVNVIKKLDESAQLHGNLSQLPTCTENDDEYNRLVLDFKVSLTRLQNWITSVGGSMTLSNSNSNSEASTASSSSTKKDFTTSELRTALGEEAHLGKEQWIEMADKLVQMEELEEEEEGGVGEHKLESRTKRWIKHLVDVFQFLFSQVPESTDFITCLEKKRTSQQQNSIAALPVGIQIPGGILNRNQKAAGDGGAGYYEYNLKIICLNPGLSFDYIRKVARTVIVASGTLNPMDALQSELATGFPIQVSAPHVVPERNVWVGVIHKSSNPTTMPSLKLVRDNQQDTNTQDELGSIILHISRVVPFGILVFVSSYTFLDALRARWSNRTQDSPLLPPMEERLSLHKRIFYEAREEQQFRLDMDQYKRAAKSEDGAIFFGVFRGKASEGVDFADDEARAVISLGIPHLNLGAPDVQHKMKYNTERACNPFVHHFSANRPLSGRQWYDAQGFRALNQGFGRVIRHINDWGAIFIVDKRFEEETGMERSKLPKWVRKNAQTFDSVEDSLQNLHQFVREKMNDRLPTQRS